jgi:hypothetical protein
MSDELESREMIREKMVEELYQSLNLINKQIDSAYIAGMSFSVAEEIQLMASRLSRLISTVEHADITLGL